MSFNITGTGMYVPERIVENSELETLVDTTDAWIRQRVGIHRRHIATCETASDMGYQAALAALEDSGTAVSELDLILTATLSSEDQSPSLACMLQHRLGADCPAFDLNAACSSFLFQLETLAGFFDRGKVKKALVVSAEQLSRLVDWSDRSTCVIFGDGAGAVVVERGDNYLDSVLSCQGGDTVIKIPRYAGKSPFWTGPVNEPYIRMQGQETFKYAVNSMSRDIRTLLERNNLTHEDVAHIIPHQANRRIIDSAAARLKIPAEKFYLNIEEYGNTSSASIPIALDEMNRKGMLRRGDLLLLTAFGGGLSSGSCLIRW